MIGLSAGKFLAECFALQATGHSDGQAKGGTIVFPGEFIAPG